MKYFHKYNKYVNKIQNGGIPEEWRNIYNNSDSTIKELIRQLYYLDRLDQYNPENVIEDREWFIESATIEIARPVTSFDLDSPSRAIDFNEPLFESQPREIIEPVNPRPPEKMPEDLNAFASRFECAVCKENAVNTRLNPCGHLICTRCYILLPEPKLCPICRTKITNDEAIFYGGIVKY